MKITLCNQKGGAGKTSLTILLAFALADVGKKIGVVDLDPQQTATRWLDTLGAGSENFLVEIADTQSDYDLIFYDTPPALGDVLRVALEASDIAILVSSPSPADLWSSQDTVAFIKKVDNKKLKKAMVFNKTRIGTRLSSDLDEMAQQVGLRRLRNTIPLYESFQHAVILGWTALSPREQQVIQKVALEISTL